MNFDFSFVPNYLPYYFEGVKYTLLISYFLEHYLDLYYSLWRRQTFIFGR